MIKLNNYLDDNPHLYTERKYGKAPGDKHIPNKCCLNKNNIILSTGLLLYVCRSCGTIMKDKIYTIDDVEKFKNYYVKTFMNYTPKNRHLHRLHKWSNYNRIEVIINDYLNFIDKLPIDNRDIKHTAKVIFKNIYPNLKIRGNVRNGLICYCLYKSFLFHSLPIDIDHLFVMLKINFKNYNDAVNKLNDDILLYPKNINLYLNKVNNEIDKNYLIKLYNNFYDKENKFNNKTLLLGLIFYILEKKENDKTKWRMEFIKKFNISDNSLFVINFHINQNKTLFNNI